jgi:sodium transport system permease protein
MGFLVLKKWGVKNVTADHCEASCQKDRFMTAWRATGVVFRKEWTDAFRDRRTLLVVLLSSVLMGPLVLVALSAFVATFEARAEKREVVVQGMANAPTLQNYLERQTYQIKTAPADFEAQF